MTHKNILIVIAKRPTPGKTKTRLVPPLTPEQATRLYECFLQDTLDLIKQVSDIQPAIAFFPEYERVYFEKLAPGFDLHLQNGAALGERLDDALQHYLRSGNCHVVIMDSDSPTLPVAYLSQAFDELNKGSEMVLGPCDDGGYYLIGLKQPAPRLLREVQMSTPHVAQDTLNIAAEMELKYSLLPIWYDIDEILTLRRLVGELEKMPTEVARSTRAFLAIPEIQNRIHTAL
jgi:uncharacterized protein